MMGKTLQKAKRYTEGILQGTCQYGRMGCHEDGKVCQKLGITKRSKNERRGNATKMGINWT